MNYSPSPVLGGGVRGPLEGKWSSGSMVVEKTGLEIELI